MTLTHNITESARNHAVRKKAFDLLIYWGNICPALQQCFQTVLQKLFIEIEYSKVSAEGRVEKQSHFQKVQCCSSGAVCGHKDIILDWRITRFLVRMKIRRSGTNLDPKASHLVGNFFPEMPFHTIYHEKRQVGYRTTFWRRRFACFCFALFHHYFLKEY